MKKYKNYLLIDMTNGENCIYYGSNLMEAVKIARAIAPVGCDLLEIWGTDEDIQTFISCETLYTRNIETGEEFLNLAAELNELAEIEIPDLYEGLTQKAKSHPLYELFMSEDTREKIKDSLYDMQALVANRVIEKWEKLFVLLAMIASTEEGKR